MQPGIETRMVQPGNTPGTRLVGDKLTRRGVGVIAKLPRCSGRVACVAVQHALHPAQRVGREELRPAQRQAEGTRLMQQHWLKGMSDRAELCRAAAVKGSRTGTDSQMHPELNRYLQRL